MVATAVRFLGQAPVTCAARPLLFRAHDALEQRQYITAGCLLREAVRLYLLAECKYHDCLPSKRGQRSPATLLQALRKAVPDCGAAWLEEIIGYGNALAHCQKVAPSLIESAISFAHFYLDHASHLVQPVAEGRLS